eukprot:scaffold804_cov165-Amphora_coffeaeformis.AAC.7
MVLLTMFLRHSPALEGIGKANGADFVGSVKHLASEIVIALDDITGTTVEQSEGLATQNPKMTIHSGNVCGSKFGWGMAERFFQYVTSCSVAQEGNDDLSRSICEEPKQLPEPQYVPLPTTPKVEEIKGSFVRLRYSPLSIVKEEDEDYEDSVTEKSRDHSRSQCDSKKNQGELAAIDLIRQTLSSDGDDRAGYKGYKAVRCRGAYTVGPPSLSRKEM